LNFSDAIWQNEVFDLERFLPGDKVAHFTIVAVVSKVHLWTYHEDLGIQDNNAAIVAVAAVEDRHAEIDDDVVKRLIFHNLLQHGHGIFIHLAFKEVVEAALGNPSV
jgi:hypothetical protein